MAFIEFCISHYQFAFSFGCALALLVFRLPRRDHFLWRLLIGVAAVLLAASFWSPDEIVNSLGLATLYFLMVVLFFATAYFSFRISAMTALFVTIGAYVMEHLAYQIEVSLSLFLGYTYYFVQLFGTYIFTYICVYFLLLRRIRLNGDLYCAKPLLAAVCVFLAFFIDYFNLAFFRYWKEPDVSLNFLVRLAIITVCIVVLILLHNIYSGSQIYKEKNLLEAMLDKDRERYQLMKETIDIINVKCHDIKHQIHRLTDQVPSNEIQDIVKNVTIYDSVSLHTGNQAMDIVLAEKSLLCHQYDIECTFQIDGHLLDFIETSEIYSLFGNALDNAIQALLKLEKKDRFLLLEVVTRFGCVYIRETNPFSGKLQMKDGLPLSSSGDYANHGFGTKSIQMIVRKYGGEMTISGENGLFNLTILFPLPSKPGESPRSVLDEKVKKSTESR